MHVLVFLLAVLLQGTPMSIWRVDSVTGSDSNPGSQAQPWASLAKVEAKIDDSTIQNGDVVEVVRGSVFNESGTVFQRTATAGAPLYFVAVGTGADPIVDAGGLGEGLHVRGAYLYFDSIKIQNATTGLAAESTNNCTFRRVEITNCTGPCFDGGSMDVSGNGHGNIVEFAHLHNSDGDGATTGTTHGWIFRHCDIHDLGIGIGSALVDGIAFHGAYDSMSYVIGCRIWNVEGKAGVSTAPLGDKPGSIVTVQDCWIRNCKAYGILGAGTAGGTVITAYNNIIVTSATQTVAGGGIVESPGSNINGWNNVIDNRATVTIVPSLVAYGGGSLVNNISIASTTKAVHFERDATAGTTFDYNLYWPDGTTADLATGRFLLDGSYVQFAAVQAAGHEAHGLSADPLLVGDINTDPANAKLKPLSPARAKGVNLTAAGVTSDYFHGDRPAGTTPWCIGVHEYVETDRPSLDSKKLRIKSKSVAGQVVVVQDGGAADGTATIKIDDGFKDGYNTALAATGGPQRVVFDIESLECTRTGRDLVFTVQDFLNRNTFSLGPGDRVEFWADNGESLAPTSGAWPSWHAAQVDGQCLHFFGFVRSVKRIERTGGYAKFRVECTDPITFANRIKLQRSKPDGVTIPWVFFNCDTMDDPDWFLSIKKYDDADSDPATRYGYGHPKDTAAATMSLAEILDYFQSAYQSDLYDRGIIAGASDDLFDAADLAAFDAIKPPKTVFESTGFGDAVRQLIKANAPEFDVVVDPRTKKWRFIATAKDIVADGYQAVTVVVTPKLRFRMASVAAFATSGTGSTVRMQSATDPRASEVRKVVVVDTVNKEIELEYVTSYAFAVGDFIVPMYADSTRPPMVRIDLEEQCSDNDLTTDLDGVYTAVSIVSRHQKTTKRQISQSVGADVAAKLEKAWDTAYESNYRPAKHQNRHTDRGKAPGNGIVIHEREQVDIGGGLFKTRLYFSEETSLYDDDHLVDDNTLGKAEWTGTAFHLLTTAAGTLNVDSSMISAIITHFSRSGYVDSPTNSIRRFRIDLDRDIMLLAPNLKAQVTDATTGDRFEMTASEVFKPANPNKRWAVGRAWKVSSTTSVDDARYLDGGACPPEVTYTGQNDQVITQAAMPVAKATDAKRSFQELNDYWGITTPGIGGMPGGWFIEPPDPPESFAELCAKLPPPVFTPRQFTTTLEHFEHEILQVRCPAAGYMGLAWLWHKHAEELQLVSERFEDETQSAQFSLVAASLWARLSAPRYSGSLNLNGTTKWLRMSDLGFRVGFGAGDTGIVAGAVTEQSRFWGLVQSIRYDFTAGSTSLYFNSSGFGESFQSDIYERQFVSQTAEMRETAERTKRMEKFLNCLATRPKPKPPQVFEGCNTSHQQQSMSRKASTIDPKQIATGTGETSMGAPPSSGGSSGGNSGSTAFHPDWVVERGYDGRAFAVSVPGGSIWGGAESATRFIPNGDALPNHVTLPQYTAEALDEMLLGVTGLDLQTPPGATIAEIGSGSTSTVIQIANSITNDGRFVGGFIEFKLANRVVRPKYEIASHTGKAITLTGAMSESVPPQGAQAWVWPARLPLLDPGDFPTGGRPFKDAAGNWFVMTGGAAVAATLTSGVLYEDATSPPNVQLSLGLTNADVTLLGNWPSTGGGGGGEFDYGLITEASTLDTDWGTII